MAERNRPFTDTRTDERTAAARAADTLRESEQCFRAVAETAIDAIVAADRDGRITYLNTAAQTMFGYDAVEVLGKPLTMLMPKRFRDPHERGLGRYLQTGKSTTIGNVIEVAGLKHDGSEFPVELSLATWTTYDGESAFAGIIRDVSERYRAAEKLRMAHAELEARVKQRTADLADKNCRLCEEVANRKRAESAQRHLLRELDHRVKNVLASIQSVTMQTLRTTGSAQELAEALLGRIDAFAHVHEALARTEWDGLDLQDLVELTLKPFNCGNGRIIWQGEPLLLPAPVVRSLGAALHELATNAAKYGALSGAQGCIEIAWEIVPPPRGPCVRIEWKESGGSPVGKPSHRGLGMAIIEDAIPYEAAGEAKLEFTPGGVRCEFLIPCPSGETISTRASGGNSDSSRTHATGGQPLAGVRVIIVEDNFAPAESLRFLLESCGCSVVGTGGTVAAALSIVDNSQFDVAILDIQLKDEDVGPVAARIRERDGRIVYLSGYADLEILPVSLRSFPILSKPVEIDRLVATIMEVMAESPNRRG